MQLRIIVRHSHTREGEGRPKINLKGEEHVAAHVVFLAR